MDTTLKTNNQKAGSLTKYRPGSFGEVASISLPLMLSMLSGTLMLFIDRIVLSHYSTEALNSAATAGTIGAVFFYSAIATCGISQVFVGQYNGAKKYFELAKPVWQMIFLALLLFIPFSLIGAIFGKYLLPANIAPIGVPYFKTIMLFAAFFPLNAALNGFFVGRGKTIAVTLITILANLINLALDIIFVFGIDNYFEAIGPNGAAIATGISQITQSMILFLLFFNKNNRSKYNTLNIKFDLNLFKKCLKVGLPNSIGHSIEIAAWASIAIMMANVSQMHLSLMVVTQSIWILWSFIIEGNQKGVSSIASNYIGANKLDIVPQIFNSAVKLQLIFAVVLAFPLILKPELMAMGFNSELNLNSEFNSQLYNLIILSAPFLWLGFNLDALTWVCAGILTAGADTKFIMYANILTSWLTAALPIYIFIVINKSAPINIMYIFTGFTLINLICFYLRYIRFVDGNYETSVLG